LRDSGIGLITVDEDSESVAIQFKAITVTQHINEDDAAEALAPVPTTWRVAFRSALDTYATKEVQGLQEASHIVEAVIRGYHSAVVKRGLLPPAKAKASAASLVDELYACQAINAARNLFGGFRSYLDLYRNVASHPVRTARAATARIKKCRSGFLEACRLAGLASTTSKAMKPKPLSLRVHFDA
jgi:hypothetical protein